LIEIPGPQRSCDSIRLSLFNSTFSPLDRAIERGAEAVRNYYNGPALRKRKKILQEVKNL